MDNVMFDWEVIGIYAGLRLSEWAQEDHVRHRDQVKQTIDGSPTAFLIDDLQFFMQGSRRISRPDALRRPYLVQQKSMSAGGTRKMAKKMNKKLSFVLAAVIRIAALRHCAPFLRGSVWHSVGLI
jgi:hypothetical protein